MAIQSKVAEKVVGWKEIKCQGFKMSKEGNHMVGWFTVIDTGDLATIPFKYPIKEKEIGKLIKTLGLSGNLAALSFPEVTDDDKMGFDAVIQGRITEKKDFLNIEDFKPSDSTPSDAPF